MVSVDVKVYKRKYDICRYAGDIHGIDADTVDVTYVKADTAYADAADAADAEFFFMRHVRR
jgi:hypothetical protein